MELYLLATDWAKLGDPGAIIALALTAMFLVLLVVTAVLKIMGVDMSADKDEVAAPMAKATPAIVPTPAAAVAPATVMGNTETVRSQPDVDGGVPAETVAVISAAVASVAPEGKQYAVKGIRKL